MVNVVCCALIKTKQSIRIRILYNEKMIEILIMKTNQVAIIVAIIWSIIVFLLFLLLLSIAKTKTMYERNETSQFVLSINQFKTMRLEFVCVFVCFCSYEKIEIFEITKNKDYISDRERTGIQLLKWNLFVWNYYLK